MHLFQVGSYLMLCSMSLLGQCTNKRIFNEGDHLLPDFDIEGLEVFDEYIQHSPNCPEVVEKVKIHRHVAQRYELVIDVWYFENITVS